MSREPSSPSASRYQIRVITSEEEFRSVEPIWNGMLSQLSNSNFFVSFEWMWTWWRCLKQGKQLLMIVANDGDKTVGIAPLMKDKRRIPFTPIPFKELRFLSTIPSAYSPCSFAGTLDILVWPGYESVREVLARYVLTEIEGFNCLRLHPLPEDSPTLSAFERAGQDLGFTSSISKVFDNACLRITGDWDTYFKQLGRKARSRLRRLAKKLSDSYEVDCVELTGLGQVGEAVNSIVEVEAGSWKGQYGVPITDSQYNDFYFELAKVLAGKGWLRVFILKADGKPIAYQYYVHYYDRVIALKTSYDRSFDQFAPGKLMIPIAFEKFFQDGVAEIDLLWGNLDFKRKWADTVHSRHEVCLYRTDPYSRFIRAVITSPRLRRAWAFYRKCVEKLRKKTA